MKKCLLLLFFLCFYFNVFGQQDAWVYLTDKANVSTSLNNPITILTQKAIDRKTKHSVIIDERDVPVNESYISQLKSAMGITVMAKSKWFNAVHVRGSETNINNLKTTFLFVDHIDFADKSLNTSKKTNQKKQSKTENTVTQFNYGNAANQIQMFNGDKLHVEGYTGAGMTIAVLDGGFPKVNTMTSFERLRNTGHILGVHDYVGHDNDVYTNTTTDHGTWVLSTMAGYIENQYVGTAPDAAYYLFITEDGNSENPVEESYWVEAAERADSLGIDVINTSLGYTTFDNPNYNYTTAQMDGNTAFITRGANIAFEKGMLLVNSAGNSGNDSWGIVGAPADAAGVLSVGAVKSDGTYALFSSKGNATQPTQKPDVVAQGQASYVIDTNDAIGTLNGTSFSSPIMAGGVTCLWQALPSLNNGQIMQLVRESASQFNFPDYFLGYGIPDLQLALVNGFDLVEFLNKEVELKIYPNPTSQDINIKMAHDDSVELFVFDILGNLILETVVNGTNPKSDISKLSSGMYIVKLQSSTKTKNIKLIKK